MSVDTFAALVGKIRERPPKAGATRVIGIDGPAGSGKSVLAARLRGLLTASMICLDDLTPAWSGPDKEAAVLVEQVLEPLATGGRPRYQFFDWAQNRYTEWRDVPPGPFLIAEGVGAGSQLVRPYLSYLVWVDAPADLRLARGLARDGEERRPDWERWREREDALFKREETRRHADLLVDGAPAMTHDPEKEYVASSL